MENTNNQTVSSYDESYIKYIETCPTEVKGDLKAWIDRNFKSLDKKSKILEIGSGSGKDANYINSIGYNIELTDASQGFVDYLISQGRVARKLNALTDDLGADYDMVFSNAVFLHFTPSELDRVLANVYKALKPNGRIVFSLKAGEGEEITDRKLGVNRYFCYWKEEDVRALLARVGLKSIEIDITLDPRGKDRPDWLFVNAVK